MKVGEENQRQVFLDEFSTKRSWEKDLGKDKGEKSLK